MAHLDEDTLECFQNSLRRCQADPEFLTIFYDRFIASNPEVAAKFAGTDMRKQKAMLSASLIMVQLASQDNEAARSYLAKVAERHSSNQRDIHPALYGLWLECLIATVAEVDPRWDDAIEKAWRQVMGYGIAFMQSAYASSPREAPG